MPDAGSGANDACPGTCAANAGRGASFGPDAIARNPWLATWVRKVLKRRPAFEQAPLPQAMIGNRFAPLNGDKSLGLYTVWVGNDVSAMTDTAKGPGATGCGGGASAGGLSDALAAGVAAAGCGVCARASTGISVIPIKAS